jgi:hypothetical protein
LATLSRDDKLKLSAETGFTHAFRQGLFAKLYEQSLWRFVNQVKPLKPMSERVKGGEPVIYGGLPLKSFEALAAENKLPGLEQMEYGWRWPVGDDEISPGYEQWRSAVLKAGEAITSPSSGGRDILKEIIDYDLAGSTPLKAMMAISDWREYLQAAGRAG